jgi:UDP-glucuronate decarboxylase
MRSGERTLNGGCARHCIVAGGAGFVGSHLCEALLAIGFHVTCIDNFRTGRQQNLKHFRSNSRFELIQADIVDLLPKSFQADVIFNLACAASPPHYQSDPVHTLMTSVVGTKNLLALAADLGATFILASTSEVYGDPSVHPQSEHYFGNVNPVGPRACYDEGKRAAETLCFDYARLGWVDARVARIFNTYGPRMREDDGRVISNLITQALTGTDITLYGRGQQTRSFCFVDDLVRGLVTVMLTGSKLPGPVNLGNPYEITILELANRVVRMTGSRSNIVHRPMPQDDPQRRCPDITRAMQLLGWSPQVSLEDGLKLTVNWFRKSLGLDALPAASESGGKRAERRKVARGLAGQAMLGSA